MTDDGLVVDGKHVTMLSDRDPANLPWGELGVDCLLYTSTLARAVRDHEAAGNAVDEAVAEAVWADGEGEAAAMDLSLIHI